jgi:hypothetical protein
MRCLQFRDSFEQLVNLDHSGQGANGRKQLRALSRRQLANGNLFKYSPTLCGQGIVSGQLYRLSGFNSFQRGYAAFQQQASGPDVTSQGSLQQSLKKLRHSLCNNGSELGNLASPFCSPGWVSALSFFPPGWWFFALSHIAPSLLFQWLDMSFCRSMSCLAWSSMQTLATQESAG